MTLEGFFTQTEMKDGLTAPKRVEELLAELQKEKDSAVKNLEEATRQWSTVASTVAATVNKDCLDLFIQLDGLWFINKWLNDAQKFGNDTSDSFLEESIFSLLQALNRLGINNERSVTSGIWITVKNLLGHSSLRIQDRARELFSGWKQPVDSNEVCQVVEEVGAVSEDGGAAVSSKHDCEMGQSECPALEESRGNACEGDFIEAANAEIPESRSTDYPKMEKLEDVPNEASSNQMNSPGAMNRKDAEDGLSEKLDSTNLYPVEENLPISEKPAENPEEENTKVDNCSSPDLSQGTREGKACAQELEDLTDDGKQVDLAHTSQEKLGEVKVASGSSSSDSGGNSLGRDVAKPEPSSKQVDFQINVDTNDEDSCLKSPMLNETRTFVSEGRSDMGTTWGRSQGIRVRPEDPESSPRVEATYAAHKDKNRASGKDEDLPNVSRFPKPKKSHVSSKTFNFDFEYGTVDALEVARRVARAVEREVVDCHEPCGSSSSEKISVGFQPGSPDSINENDSQSSESLSKDVPVEQNLSSEASQEAGTHLTNVENIVIESENCTHDIESSQVTEAADEHEGNPEKGICGFDLNEEVCSEDLDHQPISNSGLISDMDHAINTPRSIPVSVVSASRALATPGLPGAPLQFEGTLGWKGSAATSAFRAASPRRICDGDKTTNFGSTSGSPKQRQDVLDIDLNIAEDMDDKNDNLSSGKEIPVSSSLPSGESCVELGPKRTERMELDLNSMCDAGEAPQSDWRMDGRVFNHLTARRSPSPASSSSSMQPRMKNIDLNEGPIFHNNSIDEQPFFGKSPQYVNAYTAPKPANPVISILGTRVEVNGKDLFSHTASLPNGKSEEPTIDANMARAGNFLRAGTAVPYTHSSPFGYNGITMGSAMSLSSTVYGPGSSIAYMVDSRGTPVVPQVVGSSLSVPPYGQAPFIMSMTGAPSGLSWAAHSRPNIDVNSGFMNGGLHRHDLASRQIFIPGQGPRLMEEHFRADSQPSSSSEKRKEPDGGWETYPHNLKHHQHPWK